MTSEIYILFHFISEDHLNKNSINISNLKLVKI
jgi:hypothetical protein